MKYNEHWDLSSIPDPEFKSEHGRRNRAKITGSPNAKIKPCSKCEQPLNAGQRRKPCPHCGWENTIQLSYEGWVDNPYTSKQRK